MDAAARAIAEPRRREILALVRDRELSAGEIAGNFDVTRPAVSQHLTVLKDAGLLTERRDGTRRLYRARPEGLADLRDFLDAFWSERLGRLKLAAELQQQRRKQRDKRPNRSRRRGRGDDRRQP
jgi:DNA-binding transcriptional ArsR family regulator